MDRYEIFCDLRTGVRDLEFADAVRHYLDHLVAEGLIASWRLTRRKLGFGIEGLGEFHVSLDVRDLAQLDAAFSVVATRAGEVEALHSAVFSRVANARFALYRDFPDPVRADATTPTP
ncbi:MAG: hypothetical protein QOE45_1831 [Frankiaceae bacterium]|jgi:hypothetical protein|nr:hypothetical protein [Frankiaceae bacterium]